MHRGRGKQFCVSNKLMNRNNELLQQSDLSIGNNAKAFNRSKAFANTE